MLSRVAQFLRDFWYSPRAALRRYSKKRTWPTSDELERMSPEQFETHMRAHDMVIPRQAAKARLRSMFAAVETSMSEELIAERRSAAAEESRQN